MELPYITEGNYVGIVEVLTLQRGHTIEKTLGLIGASNTVINSSRLIWTYFGQQPWQGELDRKPVGDPEGGPQAESRNPRPLILLEKAFLFSVSHLSARVLLRSRQIEVKGQSWSLWSKPSACGYRGCIPTCRPHDIPNGTANLHYPKKSFR